MTATVGVAASVATSVERGLNDIRLAVLGILVTIALTVGLAAPGGSLVELVAGVASFVLASLLIRWRTSRHYMMSFMHWVTGE